MNGEARLYTIVVCLDCVPKFRPRLAAAFGDAGNVLPCAEDSPHYDGSLIDCDVCGEPIDRKAASTERTRGET